MSGSSASQVPPAEKNSPEEIPPLDVAGYAPRWVILLAVVLGAALPLSTLAGPLLEGIYADLGKPLPFPTRLYLTLDHWWLGRNVAQQYPGWWFGVPVWAISFLVTLVVLVRSRHHGRAIGVPLVIFLTIISAILFVALAAPLL